MDDSHIVARRVSPERLAELRAQVGLPPKPARKEWQRHYTVIPRTWELQLQGAKRVSTYRLALELLYRHWRDGGKPVAVSRPVGKAAKLSGRSLQNALAELERLKLVQVDRKPPKAPRATLLHVPKTRP